ncbi:MAG: phenylacetate--CoA ligase family protein [Pseudomonadota bacterium]
MSHFDLLEIRDPETRERECFEALREILTFAVDHAPALKEVFSEHEIASLHDRSALEALPVLRPDTCSLDGWATRQPYHMRHLFLAPDGRATPAADGRDWWGLGRCLHAAGIGMGDVVLNAFSHHLVPDGMMFDTGIAAISATSIPAGPDHVPGLAEAAVTFGASAFVGAPHVLHAVLDHVAREGLSHAFATAVTAGHPSDELRDLCAAQGIALRRVYISRDVGLVAYETEAEDSMVVDEKIILEVVHPGTGDHVPEGTVGDVLVTNLNPDYPVLRLATGDQALILSGESPCGRTNLRISGPLASVQCETEAEAVAVLSARR